jgi:hypothetical protein
MVTATKHMQAVTNTKLIMHMAHMHMAHMIMMIIITMNRTFTDDRQLALII